MRIAMSQSAALTTIARTLVEVSEHYYYAGSISEAIRTLKHGNAIMETPDATDMDRALLLVQCAKLQSLDNFQGRGDFDQTLAMLARARELAEGLPDQRPHADAIDLTGMTLYYRALAGAGGVFPDALPHFERALAMREQSGDGRGVAESIFHIGLIEQNTGQWQAARATFARATELARAGGYRLEHSYAVRHLGFVEQHEGNLEAARHCLAESLALREEIGFRLFLPFSMRALGEVCMQMGDIDAADGLFERAYIVATEIGSPSQTIFALLSRGELYQARGRSSDARAVIEQAAALAASAGFTRGEQLAARMLAELSAER
jgi:tetratricopeptide (TPR) repeat protein